MSYTEKGYGRALDGLYEKMQMLKSIADNIANANTIAYKRNIPEAVTFKSILGEIGNKEHSQGQIKKTNLMFDLALEGNAEFMIDTKDGLAYTRNGKFQLSKNGDLITQDGHRVVVVEKGKKPINLTDTTDIQINEKGEVFIGEEKYGRIALKLHDNEPVTVHQGHLEGSNVNIISEMMAFQMMYRSIEASDKLLGMEASVDRDLIEKYGRNV